LAQVLESVVFFLSLVRSAHLCSRIMQSAWFYFLLALVVSVASGSKTEGSAVTRVVKLLKDLEAKLEKEEQTEQDLYDKFVCWGTSTVDSKTKSMAEAKSRVDYLETYIADIGSGKLTFTMNQDQLTQELESVNTSLGNDTSTETSRHAAAQKNEADTSQAIGGLQTAVDTLQSAQNAAPNSSGSGKTNSGLVQLRGAVQSGARLGARARLQKAKKLQIALELGDQYLSRANSAFLHRMLTGQTSSSSARVGKAAVKSSGAASHIGGRTAQRRHLDTLKHHRRRPQRPPGC